MSEQQIAKLAGKLVEHQDCFGGLATDDTQWAIQNPKEAIALMCEAVKNRSAKTPERLLELVTAVSLEAGNPFAAVDHFKIDTKKAAVRIAWLGDNFKKHFGCKIDTACAAADLKIHKLRKSSLDASIITELGERCEITLGQLFTLLAKQGKGEQGSLLVNGSANIAYIRDKEGVLWAVNAYWGAGNSGWSIVADSVDNPSGWDGGRQVLSR